MAKIIKVGSQNLTPNKIANPFKTSRNSSTNPFKYSNFEGNTLPFELSADVFEGSKNGSTNKLRMIASSVTGSMNKMKSRIAEPIINFVNRVWNYAKNTNVSDLAPVKAFNEVMNTPIKLGAFSDSVDNLARGISEKLEFLNTDITDIGKGLSEGISSKMEFLNTDIADIGKGLSEGISSKMEFLNTDITDIGKGLSEGISSRMEFLNTDVTDIGKSMSAKWANLISRVHHNKISADMPVSELEQLWIAENQNAEVAA